MGVNTKTIKEGDAIIKKLKNYFSHDFNARNDIKLKKVNMELGMQGIGLYWCIVECLYENNGYLDLDQINLLAYELRVEEKLIQDLIDKYDLFKKNKKCFYSKSVLQRLEKINEISRKNKENIKKRWDKARELQNFSSNNKKDTTVLQSNYKEKENKRKENINKNKDIIITTTNNIYEYIESNFGRLLSPIEIEKIDSWLSLFDEEVIEYAVKIAVMNLNKTFNYVDGILKNWKGKNLKTLSQIKENEVLFNQLKNGPNNDKKEIFDYDWLNDSNTPNEDKELLNANNKI